MTATASAQAASSAPSAMRRYTLDEPIRAGRIQSVEREDQGYGRAFVRVVDEGGAVTDMEFDPAEIRDWPQVVPPGAYVTTNAVLIPGPVVDALFREHDA